MNKISLIGSGNIGGTLAHLIGLKGLAEVVLFDVIEGMPGGKSLDISQSMGVEGFCGDIKGTNDYQDIKNSDVVIVTAGLARKPGMSRDDLLEMNAKIIKQVGCNIAKYAPKAFVIVVTNPLDAMVHVMREATGFSHNKVVGMAGILDSSRFKYFLSKELDVCIDDISTIVMGGHGDTMVPLTRFTTVAGIALSELIEMGWITKQQVDSIVDRTRSGGGEIVSLLKLGSAFYAPASSAIAMAEAYLKNKKSIFPCAAWLTGEYGISDLYMGVPIVIGRNGVEKIIELKLSADEQEMLDNSARAVRKLTDTVKKYI